MIRDLSNIRLDEVIFALVGNENNLKDKRVVSIEEGLQFSEENNYYKVENISFLYKLSKMKGILYHLKY